MQAGSVLEEGIISFTKQRARACGSAITCRDVCKVSVLKILPALHNNYIDAGLCCSLAELLGILLMRSFPTISSVLSVLFLFFFFFSSYYTSFPELHPNCRDSVGLTEHL